MRQRCGRLLRRARSFPWPLAFPVSSSYSRAMKSVAGLVAALLVSASASAQTVVRWTAKVDPVAQVRAGAGLEVVLDARIDPGWHLYAITQEKGGPQPLVIAVPARLAVSPGWQRHRRPCRSRRRMPTSTSRRSTTPRKRPSTCRCPFPPALLAARRSTSTSPFKPARIGFAFRRRPNASASCCSSLAPAPTRRSWPEPPAAASGAPRAAVEDMADATAASTFGAYLGLAALMGALSLLTPCVFPMVPITVSYFTGRAEKDRGRAVSQALVYGLGIVLTFTGVGVAARRELRRVGPESVRRQPLAQSRHRGALHRLCAQPVRRVRAGAAVFAAHARVGAGSGRGRYAGTLLMGAGVHADVVHLHRAVSRHAPRRGVAGRLAAGRWRACSRFRSVFALPFVALALAPQAIASAAALGRVAALRQGDDGPDRTGGGDEVPVERRSGVGLGRLHAARS